MPESPERVLDWLRRLRNRFLTRGGTGIQVAVTLAATSVTVTFPNGMTEPDTSYGIAATPSWSTTCYVSARTTTSFTLSFGTAAPANATADYIMFRS